MLQSEDASVKGRKLSSSEQKGAYSHDSKANKVQKSVEWVNF